MLPRNSRLPYSLKDEIQQYINPIFDVPVSTVELEGIVTPKTQFIAWKRQGKLILVALFGAITMPLQPLVSLVTTSLEAWTTLASTFGRPSRGHLKQIKEQLKKSTKGQQTIDEYLQLMKTKADQLALLGKPLDHEDIIEYILDSLPMKHVAVDYHFIHDLVQQHKLHVSHITATDQLADALTKPPTCGLFHSFCAKIRLSYLDPSCGAVSTLTSRLQFR